MLRAWSMCDILWYTGFRGNTLSLASAQYFWASVGCGVIGCQGILAWYVRGLLEALLPGASLITQLAHSSWRDDMLKT